MATMSPKSHKEARSAAHPEHKPGALPRLSEVTLDRIRARAFEIYLERNRNGGVGDAESDWLRAEQELKSGTRFR